MENTASWLLFTGRCVAVAPCLMTSYCVYHANVQQWLTSLVKLFDHVTICLFSLKLLLLGKYTECIFRSKIWICISK
jgi:hypothetical protein